MLKANAYTTFAVALVAAIAFSVAFILGGELEFYGAAGIVTLIAFLFFMAASHGRNFFDRRKVKKNFKYPEREGIHLLQYGEDKSGFVIDKDEFSMFIELTNEPYSVTTTDTELEPIPLNLLKNYMYENGVRPKSINVMSFGMRTIDSGAFSRVYDDVIPPERFSVATTVIQVTIDLKSSTDDVYQRTGTTNRNDSSGLLRGISRTLNVATRHICDVLSARGWQSKVMTRDEIEPYHTMINKYLSDGFANETWRDMPGTPSVKAAFSKNSDELPVLSDSHSRCVILSRTLNRETNETITCETAVLAAHDTDVPVFKKLLPADGIQGDVATRVLPLAHTVKSHGPIVPVTKNKDISAIFPAHGAGIYVGNAAVADDDGDLVPDPDIPVYLSFEGTKGDLLYIDAPESVKWSLASRLAGIGEDVVILTKDEEEKKLCRNFELPTLRTDTKAIGSTVAIINREYSVPSNVVSFRLTVAMTDTIPRAAVNSLKVSEDNMAVLTTKGRSVSFFWNITEGERTFIPAD